jgi:hypothetical protein
MIFGKRTERYQAKKAEDQNSEGEPEKTGDGQPRASDSQQARSESSAIEGERRQARKGMDAGLHPTTAGRRSSTVGMKT